MSLLLLVRHFLLLRRRLFTSAALTGAARLGYTTSNAASPKLSPFCRGLRQGKALSRCRIFGFGSDVFFMQRGAVSQFGISKSRVLYSIFFLLTGSQMFY